MTVFVVLLVALLILAFAIRGALVAYAPPRVENLVVESGQSSGPAGSARLHVLSWNIGYAGLGRGSEFFADGGHRLRAPSRATVVENLSAIAQRLRDENADVCLIQELARPNVLTYGVNVFDGVRSALQSYAFAYAPGVRITGIPFVGNLEVSNATFARYRFSKAVRHALPSEKSLFGITTQHFNALETQLPLGASGGDPMSRSPAGAESDWVVFNVHLAAFDDGTVRRRQVEALVELLRAEYAAGHHVIAGGDWNLRLAPTEFPYTTPEKTKFWVRDFPKELTPPGWTWAVDSRSPTCRTLEQPFTPGVNYTCIIDGILVSPNVEVLGVEALDLGFANSDHNPVRLQVRAL